MIILLPVDVNDVTLTSSSIPEDDFPEWAVGTTYDRGDFVISIATHRVYSSLTDSNVGNDPDAEQLVLADPLQDDPDPIRCQIIGATNRWRMFDKKTSVRATAAEQIEVVVTPGRFTGGIAGFNVDANSVTVVSESVAGGGEVFNMTLPLQDETLVVDWYT
jgi:hypothetical protein